MSAIQTALVLCYPALIFLGLRAWSPRAVALVALGLLVARILLVSPARLAGYARALAAPGVAIAATLAAAAVWNHALFLLLTPSLVSLALLVAFARTLARGAPMIERLARLAAPDLSPDEVAYCRRVTWVWCGFFLGNAAVALALALAAPVEVWVLYTGLIAYLAIGSLFAGEYLYRHWRFRRYVGASTDPLLRRVFPPRSAPSR